MLELLAELPGREHESHRLGQEAAARRTRASAPMPGPATVRRPPRTAADVPPRPPRGGSARRARPGSGPARPCRHAEDDPERVALRSRHSIRPRRAAARTAGAGLRRPTPSRTRLPSLATTLMSAAEPTRCSSSAVLPIPASPLSTSERLSPRRTDETKSSRSTHSCSRPHKRVPPGRPLPVAIEEL